MKINTISPQEREFTEVLIPLELNVKMLYYYGKMPKKCHSVAIVGARKNTSYGYEVAYKAAYAAARAGAVVVSGLAYGIDSVAHRGALDAGGVTVAVLGTPIDHIYPYRHKGLAEEIVAKGGAVISEYAPGARAESRTEGQVRFLRRNRIIAGLSEAVLVAEAAERSGSLNTAVHAISQGKELLVAPGDITRPSSQGCNKLLAQGALVYTEPADLLEAVFGVGSEASGEVGDIEDSGGTRTVGGLQKKTEVDARLLLAGTEVERKVLELLISGVDDGEAIMARAGISASGFSQAVTILEIKGAVRALGANRWMVKGA